MKFDKFATIKLFLLHSLKSQPSFLLSITSFMIPITQPSLPDQQIHQSCQTLPSAKHYLGRRPPSGIFSPRTINLTPVFRSLERIITPTKTEYDTEPEFQLIDINRDVMPRKTDNLQLTSSSLIFSPALSRHGSQCYNPSERLKTLSTGTSPRSSPFFSARQKASSISAVMVPHSVLIDQDQRLLTAPSKTRIVFQSPRTQQNMQDIPQVVDFFTIRGLSPKSNGKSKSIKIQRVNSRVATTTTSLSKRVYTPSVTKKDAFTSCKDLKVKPESVRRVHTAVDDYKRGSGRYKLSDIFDLKPRRVKTKVQEVISGACYGNYGSYRSYRKE